MKVKKLPIIISLAWRNVWKNRRRTVLTMITIVMGTGMIFFMNALQKGGQEKMIDDAAAANTAHIQIHEMGFWDNSGIDYAFRPTEKLLKELNRLKKYNRIEAFGARLHAEGLISYGNKTSGGSIQAVDPDREKKVCGMHAKILKGGRYLIGSDRKHIVIGKDLAKSIGAGLGDVISVISQGFDGSIAAENLTIVGLFQTGDPELDRYLAVMPIARAMDTFAMMGYVNSIAVRLKRSDDIPVVRDIIRKAVNQNEIEVMDCYELMPELMQHLEMDRYPAMIFNFILLVVAAFGILNTIQMSVFERIREFGVMLAIGTRPGQVTAMVLCESMFITLIGIGAGLVIGSLACYYFILNPIDYSGMGDELNVYGISSSFSYSPKITALNIALTSILIFASSLLFSLLPARKAGALRPIEAIRHL
jgi:putative ABC transport system permease protein